MIQPMTILMVDDKPDNLLALEALLQGRGYQLVTALSGEDALRAVRAHDFALILLDVKMPGVDGFETARLIRAREASRLTPIIFLTAEVRNEEMIAKGYALGAVDYVVKPLAPEILRAKIEAVVEVQRIHEALRRSESNFRNSIEGSADGVFVVDPEGLIVSVNGAAARLFGKSKQQLLQSPFGFPCTSGETSEVEVIQSAERFVDVEMRVTGIEWEGQPAFLASLRDMTERKRAEEEVRTTQRRAGASGSWSARANWKTPTRSWSPSPIPSRTTCARPCATSRAMSSCWTGPATVSFPRRPDTT